MCIVSCCIRMRKLTQTQPFDIKTVFVKEEFINCHTTAYCRNTNLFIWKEWLHNLVTMVRVRVDNDNVSVSCNIRLPQ